MDIRDDWLQGLDGGGCTEGVVSLDVETSGIDPSKHKVLSIGAVHLGSKRDFYVEIDWPEVLVSLSALEINGIDLRPGKGYRRFPPGKALALFKDWLDRLPGSMNPLIALSKQPWFDLAMLKAARYGGYWPFSHRAIDLNATYRIIGAVQGKDFAYVRNSIEEEVRPGLNAIMPVHKPHHALYDAWEGALCWAASIRMMSGRRRGVPAESKG